MDAVVTHISLNSAGGGELVCLSVVEALRYSGYQVTLTTVDKTDWVRLNKIFGKITIPNREFYLLSHLPKTPFDLLNSALQVAFFWAELLLMKLINRSCLIINTCGEKAHSLADISYLNGIPLRCAFLAETDIKRRCLIILYNCFSKIFDKTNYSLIVTNSKFDRALIKGCMKKSVTIVYPPVRLQEFRDLGLKRKSENIVLTYSQYVPTQNLDYVLRIADVAKQAHFVIIGPSGRASKNTYEGLRRLANELSVSGRVTFLTNQPFSKYVELLSTAKVFLRTLQNEPFGISVVESMAAGCVPLVPRNGGPWLDILDQTQGKYGYGYKSFEEAGTTINKLMENERLRREIAERASARAKIFEESIFEEKIRAIVKEAAKRKHKDG